jgi:cellulose synthase (UDP-forming)
VEHAWAAQPVYDRDEALVTTDGPRDWRATRAPQTRWGRWWEAHPVALRTVAAVALGWGSVYLLWRLAETGRGIAPLAFYSLWLVELYNFTSLAFLGFYGWRWSEPHRPPATAGYRVDVFVATYNEPREVLEATLAGCAALRYPHETYLLDDGGRPELEALAAEWGAHWIARPDNSHAKAGNINHALGCTSGELIFCLDADHVPLPDALDAIVGYFDDDKVALVQSPHDFYNQDSVQHYEPGRHEQSMFFEVVCPGKDRHNGVFWCGSAALLRRRALVGVGGVSTETIAEDFHSTIKLHRAGWQTRYHDEILVQGIAPHDLDGYLLQRDRWARGNLAVLTLPESPLGLRCGLTLRQRTSYFGSLFAYGAGASRLLMIVVLVAVLAGGVLPAHMTVMSLAVLWAPWTVLAIISASALCRGHLRSAESSHYTLITAAIFTRALRCALHPSRTKFKVTPKAGVDAGGARALRSVRPLLVVAAALAGALVWRGLGLLGYVHPRPLPAWAATFAMLLGTWELYRVVGSLRTVFRRRQRRSQVRFACLAPAAIADQADQGSYGRVVDVSVSGVGLVVAHEVAIGARLQVEFALPGLDGQVLPVAATVAVQSARPAPSAGWRLGTAITHADGGPRHNLIRYCYVVHPCQRLRESRLEAPEPGAEVVPIGPVHPAANDDKAGQAQRRPAGLAAGGRR